jgi:hypothetical protein
MLVAAKINFNFPRPHVEEKFFVMVLLEGSLQKKGRRRMLGA